MLIIMRRDRWARMIWPTSLIFFRTYYDDMKRKKILLSIVQRKNAISIVNWLWISRKNLSNLSSRWISNAFISKKWISCYSIRLVNRKIIMNTIQMMLDVMLNKDWIVSYEKASSKNSSRVFSLLVQLNI